MCSKMTSTTILSPVIPFVTKIEGNMQPGRMIRIQGVVPHDSRRFDINLQCGPSDGVDIAMHLTVRLYNNTAIRNTLQNKSWGPEESHGQMPFSKGQNFETLILCESTHYKIAVNGQHFAEYNHRIPFQRVTHLQVTDGVFIGSVQIENDYPKYCRCH